MVQKTVLSLLLLLSSIALAAPDAGASTELADPVTRRQLYFPRELSDAELKGRTLRELSLMRNWIFARAGNKFRKAWLDEFFRARRWYSPRDKQDLTVLTEYDKRNAALIGKFEAKLSDEELRARRAPLIASLKKDPGYPKQPSRPEDVIELALIASRLGEWVEPKPGAVAASPLEDPKRLDALLTLKDLENLSRRDLRILRNTVYARHGRPFKSQLMQDYFAEMDWYEEDAKYSDKRLTKIDEKNIKLIQSVENELGGAMSEQEQMMEEYGSELFGGA